MDRGESPGSRSTLQGPRRLLRLLMWLAAVAVLLPGTRPIWDGGRATRGPRLAGLDDAGSSRRPPLGSYRVVPDQSRLHLLAPPHRARVRPAASEPAPIRRPSSIRKRAAARAARPPQQRPGLTQDAAATRTPRVQPIKAIEGPDIR